MNIMLDVSTGGASLGSGASPVVSFAAFVNRLNCAGVDICDMRLVRYLFRSIGAYRLTPYVSFVCRSDVPGSLRNMRTVYDLFMLDRDVRSEMIRAIDIVETYLKARCIAAFIDNLGDGALSDPGNFKHPGDFLKTMRIISRDMARIPEGSVARGTSADGVTFVSAAIDAATFGAMSRLLGNVKDPEVVRSVAESFATNKRCLVSWLRTTSFARNSFAHFEPYVVRSQIPTAPKSIHGVDYDNAAPLYILFVVARLLEGMAETGGAREERDVRGYGAAVTRILGSFTWDHPILARQLRIPYDFVCGYADPLLPAIAPGCGDASTRYLAVAA